VRRIVAPHVKLGSSKKPGSVEASNNFFERKIMTIRLKRLAEQVIVITGATSGIGLTTARMAARRGARLVLAARSEEALGQLARELSHQGTRVATVAADVGDESDVARIARTAIERFGHIDTWVNNAGISVYGRLEEVATEDARRLFDTNFWGVVYGSLEAVKHFRQRGGGGALINLGSEVSDVALPLQGMYCASKHAIKAFTNSLRIELEKEKVPVAVTLIKPAAIDTMFPVHAKNYMDKEPTLPPPVYAPELAANAILYCAEHPKREIFVGGASKMMSAASYHMPRTYDRIARMLMFRMQKTDRPRTPGRSDALHACDPRTELRQRGGVSPRVMERSAYTAASLRFTPLARALIGGGVLFAAWSLSRRGTAQVSQLQRQ
jgi:short-subunit dehydrogenase